MIESRVRATITHTLSTRRHLDVLQIKRSVLEITQAGEAFQSVRVFQLIFFCLGLSACSEVRCEAGRSRTPLPAPEHECTLCAPMHSCLWSAEPFFWETRMKRTVLLILLSSMLPPAVSAQSNFFHAWEDRVRATSARQPAWPVPVIASPSTIVQLARVDFVRQYTSAHTLTWNYDNGKGVNLIPFAPTEFDINLPPNIQHNTPKVADGAGDLSMIAKYRPFASSEKGNYSTLVQLAFSVPRGVTRTGPQRRR